MNEEKAPLFIAARKASGDKEREKIRRDTEARCREERREYFEDLMKKLGITKEEGRKAYIEFLINQKRSDRWLNQKLDIEVLEDMVKEEKRND